MAGFPRIQYRKTKAVNLYWRKLADTTLTRRSKLTSPVTGHVDIVYG